MALQPLDGFESLQTHHCITGSLRHVYEFHRYPVSEDLLLGLGAGVGFLYWHTKGTLPFYGGRANFGRSGAEGLEKTTGRRTGVAVETFETSSTRKAEKALLQMLTDGEPVMVYVDMGFLPYFEFPEEFHFGAHTVVVAGYDPETRQVLIADRDEKLHPVSLEALNRARGSTYKPFPPHNKWYTFDFDVARTPTLGEVRQAIREVTTGMLEPPISNQGVKGIRKAVKRTLQWPQIMDEEALRNTCLNIFFFIDAEGGTGGGIFRYMYGRFLEEAAQITGDEGLAEVGKNLLVIGDQWQAVAEVFKQASGASDPAAFLPEVTQSMLAIADCEETTWRKLHELI